MQKEHYKEKVMIDSEDVYIKCSCGANDHIVCFKLVDNTSSKLNPEVDLYINVQMRHTRRFFERVWIALKYVFKSTPCNYGY